MKRIYLILCLILLVIVILLLTLLRHNRQTTAQLQISGTIEATTIETSFRIPGRVTERAVDEGATVKAGQLLARLETDDLERELRQRQADLEAARAAASELRAGSRSEEIAQGRATVARLQAEATRTTSDLNRQEGLFRKEVIATRDIEAARAAAQAAQAALGEAQERLRLLISGPRRETVQQASARAESAAAALALSQNRLAHATLTAPASGIILAKHVEPGEQVAAGTPIVTIGQLDEVWVRGFIPETDLGRIRVGQVARVSSDTYRGKVYPGTVSFIAQEAEFTPKNVQSEKERVKLVYRIKISLKNPNHELKPGMPVDAVIESPGPP